jgi:ABC-type transport system involved in multi-copper enzyme maturation permease subunit
VIAKELRDVWWKFAAGTLLFLWALWSGPTPYAELVDIARTTPAMAQNSMPSTMPSIFENVEIPKDPVEFAMQEMALFHGGVGKVFFVPVAAVFGIGLISGEVSRNTIFLLLSRPTSRTRLLLTKYAVGAVALLGVASLFSVGLVISAGVRGYPLGSLSITGVALSTVLLWLGALSVFGVALLFSVVIRSMVVGIAAVLLIPVVAYSSYGYWANYFLDDYEALGLTPDLVQGVMLPYFWSSESLYLGEGLAATNFLICLITAIVPLLAALWLFRRKAY